MTELSRKHCVHANQIRAWKDQLLAGATGLFASGTEMTRDQDQLVRDFHAKISELTVERDFVSTVIRPW